MAELGRMPVYEAEKLGNGRHFVLPSIRKYMYVCVFVVGSLAWAARDRLLTFAVENTYGQPSSLAPRYRTALLTYCACCRRSLKSTADLEAER